MFAQKSVEFCSVLFRPPSGHATEISRSNRLPHTPREHLDGELIHTLSELFCPGFECAIQLWGHVANRVLHSHLASTCMQIMPARNPAARIALAGRRTP